MIAYHIVPTNVKVHPGDHPVEGYTEQTNTNLTPGFHRDSQGNLISNTSGHDEFRDINGNLVSSESGSVDNPVYGEYRNARGDILRSAIITHHAHVEIEPVRSCR
jgi:hypothetical protein